MVCALTDDYHNYVEHIEEKRGVQFSLNQEGEASCLGIVRVCSFSFNHTIHPVICLITSSCLDKRPNQ